MQKSLLVISFLFLFPQYCEAANYLSGVDAFHILEQNKDLSGEKFDWDVCFCIGGSVCVIFGISWFFAIAGVTMIVVGVNQQNEKNHPATPLPPAPGIWGSGVALLAVGPALMIATPLIVLFGELCRTQAVVFKNYRIRKDQERIGSKSRDYSRLSDTNILYIKDIIFANSGMMQRLDVGQTLVLALSKEDRAQFRKLVERQAFSAHSQPQAVKFLELITMKDSDIETKVISDPDVIMWFKSAEGTLIYQALKEALPSVNWPTLNQVVATSVP
jgi:hypothetical protein